LTRALSEFPDAWRLPHCDPGDDQQREDDEADNVLELVFEGRVQVGDQHETRDQMDGALGFALLRGAHRSSSCASSDVEA